MMSKQLCSGQAFFGPFKIRFCLKIIVRIEFQRVQTFLFAVPRLADIVGANSLLGEILRYALPELAIENRCCPPEQVPGHLPDALVNDPVSSDSSKELAEDNPKALWVRGLLARDGGHFRALFGDEEHALKFIEAARFLLREKLPGLRFEIDYASLAELEKKFHEDRKEPGKRINPSVKPLPATSECLFSLPLLQPCEEAGNGPAIEIKFYSANEKRSIGLPAKLRKIQWDEFKNKKTHDIAAIMQRALNLYSAESFEDLCVDDYLALIHADGNGLGKASQNLKKHSSWLEQEAEIERFYLTMRVTLRRALERAVTNLFGDEPRKGLQILMLGGDDLLIACRAPLALRLVNHLAQALNEIQNGVSDYPRLTFGAGIAIAKPSFPFHRLHDLAEDLAASAKRFVRGMQTPVSVVDWAICSESWHGDLQEIRRSSQWLRYTVGESIEESLALSAKPYRIVKQGTNEMDSLAALIESVENVGKTSLSPAQSQLRDVLRHLRKGRRQADSAFQNLEVGSPQTWDALRQNGFQESLWRQMNPDANRWLTHFGDWLEIWELHKLKFKTEKNK